jgi:hypothetical protein
MSWEEDLLEDLELPLLLLSEVEADVELESELVEASREHPAAKTIIAASNMAAAFLKWNFFIISGLLFTVNLLFLHGIMLEKTAHVLKYSMRIH